MEGTMIDGLESVWEGEGMSAQEIKETVEANLVPKGRWQGQLAPVNPETDIKTVETEGRDHPLEGKKVVRCHAILQTDDGVKHVFFDAFPSKVMAVSKKGGSYIRQESTNAALLYAATKMHGRPFGEVLAYAAENFLVYDIGIKPERE